MCAPYIELFRSFEKLEILNRMYVIIDVFAT